MAVTTVMEAHNYIRANSAAISLGWGDWETYDDTGGEQTGFFHMIKIVSPNTTIKAEIAQRDGTIVPFIATGGLDYTTGSGESLDTLGTLTGVITKFTVTQGKVIAHKIG